MFLNSMKSFLLGLTLLAIDSSMAQNNLIRTDACDNVVYRARSFLSSPTLRDCFDSASAAVENYGSDRLSTEIKTEILLSLRIAEDTVSMISEYDISSLSKNEAHFLLQATMSILCTINSAPTLMGGEGATCCATAFETIRDNLKPIVNMINNLYHFHTRSNSNTLSNNFEDHFRALLDFVERCRRISIIRTRHDDPQERPVEEQLSGRQQNG